VSYDKQEKFLCSALYILKYKDQVTSLPSGRDKLKHCTLSCLVARKCPDAEIELVGLIKELVDLIGPGDSDRADMVANRKGISLAKTTQKEGDCLRFCSQLY
jgi:hypothetical protein